MNDSALEAAFISGNVDAKKAFGRRVYVPGGCLREAVSAGLWISTREMLRNGRRVPEDAMKLLEWPEELNDPYVDISSEVRDMIEDVNPDLYVNVWGIPKCDDDVISGTKWKLCPVIKLSSQHKRKHGINLFIFGASDNKEHGWVVTIKKLAPCLQGRHGNMQTRANICMGCLYPTHTGKPCSAHRKYVRSMPVAPPVIPVICPQPLLL